jgi:HEAT repeat protein
MVSSLAVELEAALKAEDFNRAVLALKGVGRADNEPALERSVIDLLARAPSAHIRNAIAIALADLGSTAAATYLRKLLAQENTKGARGTLLYALEELGASIDLPLLVRVLVDDESIEVWSECIRAIEDGRVAFDKATLPEQVKLLRDRAEVATSKQHRERLAEAASIIERPDG